MATLIWVVKWMGTHLKTGEEEKKEEEGEDELW